MALHVEHLTEVPQLVCGLDVFWIEVLHSFPNPIFQRKHWYSTLRKDYELFNFIGIHYHFQ
jgi:hypothetical protein